MGALSIRLRIALIATAVVLFLPLVVFAITARPGPSEGPAIGTLVVMALAFVAGLSASIAAIRRRERFGWAALVATILVPALWFLLIVVAVIYCTVAISLP